MTNGTRPETAMVPRRVEYGATSFTRKVAASLSRALMLNKPLFAHIPKDARNACTGLLVVAILSVIIACIFILPLFFSDRWNRDPDGWYVFIVLGIYFSFLAIGGFVAMTLISKGMRIGRVLAWIMLPFYLVNNLIFIVVGVFVIISLLSEDMKRHLRMKVDHETTDEPTDEPTEI